jgi:ABC-type proline/glycine betaine transport system ATPase subunit
VAADFEEVLAAIREAAPIGEATIVIVAVDGFSGAGKSTLAGRLSQLVGATIVHTDDFAAWDNPLDWWPRLVRSFVRIVTMPIS